MIARAAKALPLSKTITAMMIEIRRPVCFFLVVESGVGVLGPGVGVSNLGVETTGFDIGVVSGEGVIVDVGADSNVEEFVVDSGVGKFGMGFVEDGFKIDSGVEKLGVGSGGWAEPVGGVLLGI